MSCRGGRGVDCGWAVEGAGVWTVGCGGVGVLAVGCGGAGCWLWAVEGA